MFVDGCPANMTSNGTSPLDLLTQAFESEEQGRLEYDGLSIYRLSYMWQGAFAVLSTIGFGLLISLLTGKSDWPFFIRIRVTTRFQAAPKDKKWTPSSSSHSAREVAAVGLPVRG